MKCAAKLLYIDLDNILLMSAKLISFGSLTIQFIDAFCLAVVLIPDSPGGGRPSAGWSTECAITNNKSCFSKLRIYCHIIIQKRMLRQASAFEGKSHSPVFVLGPKLNFCRAASHKEISSPLRVEKRLKKPMIFKEKIRHHTWKDCTFPCKSRYINYKR